MDPADFEPGKKTMIPLPIHRDDPVDQALLAKARHRTFNFGRSSPTDEAPWTIKTDGGGGFRHGPQTDFGGAPALHRAHESGL